MISNQTVSRRTSHSGTPLLDSFIRHQTSRCSASETVGDHGGTFKSGTGTERGYGGPTTRNQGAPSSASALDRHGLNFFDQLLERNGTAPIQKLARELLGAGGRALEGHQQSGLHLRLRARDFRLVNGFGGSIYLANHDVHQLGEIGGIRSGVQAKHSDVRIGCMEGIDCVAEAALLAYLLEQA